MPQSARRSRKVEGSTRAGRTDTAYSNHPFSGRFPYGYYTLDVLDAQERWKDYPCPPLPDSEGGRIPRTGPVLPKGGRITFSGTAGPIGDGPCETSSATCQRVGNRVRKKTALRPFPSSLGGASLFRVPVPRPTAEIVFRGLRKGFDAEPGEERRAFQPLLDQGRRWFLPFAVILEPLLQGSLQKTEKIVR